MQKKIIVIGGGMAGTSAAHSLLKKGYAVTILEKNDRLGGRMRSQLVDGLALEQGAGFIMDIYANVLCFLREQGLHKDLLRNSYASPGIVCGGKVRFFEAKNILSTSLLSWKAKFKGVLFLLTVLRHWRTIDIHRPWKIATYDDASIGDLRRTAAGAELFDYFVQPALTGTWYWPPEDVARTSEGILLIAGKAILRGGTYKMRGGLQRIPEKAAEGSTVLLRHTVTQAQKQHDGTYVVTVTHDGKERVLQMDGIVCATTATAASRLFPDIAPERRAFIDSIRYSSVAYVGRTYRKEDLRRSKSIAIPNKENSPVTGITSMRGSKVGWVKISAADKELCEKDEETILKTLIDGSRFIEKEVLIPDAIPLSTFVWHWDEALPNVRKGYFKELERFVEAEEASHEPLVFAGDYIGGAFIEGAFTSGMQAAERLDAILSIKNS